MDALDAWIERIYTEKGVYTTFNSKVHNLDDMIKSEWNPEFEKLCRNRLLMGALRYGPLNRKYRGIREYDNIGSALDRLKKYKEEPNLEILVDVANFMLLEFTLCRNIVPFISIDDGEHCKTYEEEHEQVFSVF